MAALSLRDPDRDYRAGWIELLFDLAFVVALGATTHTLVGVAMPDGLVQFFVLFLLFTWSWTTFTFFVGVFDGAENWHFFAFAQMAVVLVLATFHDLYGQDYTAFVIGYSGLRLTGVLMFLIAWRTVPDARHYSTVQILGITLALVPMWCGLGSQSPELREGLLLTTALLQVCISPIAFWSDRNVAFNTTHSPERVGLFITLAFGECFLSVARVGEHAGPITFTMISHALAAVLVIFSLWRLYFSMLATIEFAGRQSRAILWMLLHLPLVMCILGLATGLERNLLFLNDGGAVASDRLLVAWGVAVLVVVSLGLFWRGGPVNIRAIVWRAMAAVFGATSVAAPLLGVSLTPEQVSYGLGVASVLVMFLNPAMRPWGFDTFPTDNRL